MVDRVANAHLMVSVLALLVHNNLDMCTDDMDNHSKALHGQMADNRSNYWSHMELGAPMDVVLG